MITALNDVAPALLAQLTDEEVVDRVRRGDTPLFELLMRRHNQRLFRTARAILKDDAEAEDVMQETYVLAFGHLADFEGRARFSTWLTRIAVREGLARLRKRRRFASVEDSFGDDADGGEIAMTRDAQDPEKIAGDRELARAIEAAIDELPTSFRAVFVLRAVEEMSGAEVAEALDIPEETVKTRLHRARTAIQKRLLVRTDALTPDVYQFHLSRCDRVVEAVMKRIARRGPPETT